MTQLYRAWFRSKKDGRYLQSYKTDTMESFSVQLTDDPDEAVSLVTDITNDVQLETRLFQAVLRHPDRSSIPLFYSITIEAFQIVRHYFEIVTDKVDPDVIEGREVTYAVGDVLVDYDRFGAERQIARDNNRVFNLDEADWAKRQFTVLAAGHYVDSDTGQAYAGMTVAGPDQPTFWALPDELLEWSDLAYQMNNFPCVVEFGRLENGDGVGAMQLSIQLREDAE
ncbi:hypothetical protein [Lacticaseibacillus mingshuiensis]|uniref:hypothetical protein n=1 Tax=Lacticaseibacillus mingshuiensis TaxID=2799574 RepID=UPI00194E11E5|nr:hypothetical protein [Lacticaseibacillus mingshuiensis]